MDIWNRVKRRFSRDRDEDEVIMYIIAGLGNPEPRYDKTRHNIGFDVIDAIAEEYRISIRDKKCNALCGSGVIAGRKLLLVKPQTYMNNSGEALGALLRFYKLDPATQLLVIYDDISLAPGQLRVRLKGSAGGHNGMKSVIAHAGTTEFARIKVGVGEKPEGWDLVDHVLGRFDSEDRVLIETAIADAVRAAELIVAGDAAQAMNRYNSKKNKFKTE